MTYYKQFAEILGLELGQEFSITSADEEQTSSLLYKITKAGIFSKDAKDTCGFWGLEPSTTVDRLLSGVLEVVHKPWKPKDGDAYWKWATHIELAQFKHWNGTSTDFACWKLGNCFKTSEEAQSKGKEIMEQIKAEYEEV